jgi:enterochelin esterase-like enzyme
MSRYKHPQPYPAGRVVSITVDSQLLRDNPWDDPAQRQVNVYLPPGYDTSHERYPFMLYLAAYTGSGLKSTGWRAFEESVPERLDRLIGEGLMGPVVMAFPDCFTRLGGNQYLDSAGMGQYASFLHEELLPAMADQFRIKFEPAHRAVLGKSSGGFAAMRCAMDWPGQWGAIANHSGDAGFDLLYQRDFPVVADVLANYGGDPMHFLKRFWKSKKVTGGDIHTLMMLCMAATYDPADEPQTIRLPFDVETCELIPERWANWQAHDPVQRVATSVNALSRLNGLWMDCGSRDQYMIHYGMRRLHKALENHAIEHIYEEFNGTHSGIDYRLDESLPYLYGKIA